MKQPFTKKLVSGLVMGGLALSIGAVALAYDGQQEVMPRPGMHDMHNPDNRQQYINTRLNVLVNDSTINQDQATKLISFFKERDHQRKSEMEKMRSMTPEERAANHQQASNQRPDIIDQLKDVADLSDEQAKAVADAIRPPHRPNPEGNPRCPMMPSPN